MDSDKALCVRVESGDSKVVQIVSLASGSITNKFPMAAESAILCPDGKTIAVRAGGALQLYNLPSTTGAQRETLLLPKSSTEPRTLQGRKSSTTLFPRTASG